MKKVRIEIGSIEEVILREENDSYRTRYVRIDSDKFEQRIEDVEEPLCPWCGKGINEKDHSQCSQELIDEEQLIDLINELKEDSKDPDNSTFIFTINGKSYKVK